MTQTTTPFRVPTDLLWGIANKQGIAKTYKYEDVNNVLGAMYPGINYYSITGVHMVLSQFARQEIAQMYPQLTQIESDAAAIKALGETLEVKTVRPCQGYEWENWQPITSQEQPTL